MTDSTATPSAGVGSSAAVFVVLRRMRVPLIVLIVIFTFSVVGLTLITGDSPEGPWRMTPFDAFYFMSYTATTIGFGEIPKAFNDAQRMWVTLSIYLSVIGWAYAIGSLLALLQDSSFKRALAVQRFRRRVLHLREPFWLMAGHGQTGEVVGLRLDDLGRRFVVLDLLVERVDQLDLGSYRSDVPALDADARNPEVLSLAGLSHPSCEGVLALTDDDEANLAVTMAASVLRPDLPIIVRSTSAAMSHRMMAFGAPTIINPFDRFGDHFRIEMRAPAAEQLATWLISAPGTPLPDRHAALERGRWVVCGFGRFGVELTRDLRADGLEVVVIDGNPAVDDPGILRGDGTDPGMLSKAGLQEAVGFVAGTDNDITNLSLIAAARRVNPSLFIVGRQNLPMNAELFAALDLDLLMVPSQVVAHEALAHIGTPRLWEFLQLVPGQDEAWAAALVARIVQRCGDGSPELWLDHLTPGDSPALARVLSSTTPVAVGDLLRDPANREDLVAAVVLMVVREGESILTPGDGFELRVDDTLLIAGDSMARRAMESTLMIDTSAAYVLTGDRIASGWLWRTLQAHASRS